MCVTGALEDAGASVQAQDEVLGTYTVTSLPVLTFSILPQEMSRISSCHTGSTCFKPQQAAIRVQGDYSTIITSSHKTLELSSGSPFTAPTKP